jgi:Single-strand binding protein family
LLCCSGLSPTFHTTAKGTLIASFPIAVHLEDGSTTWHKIAAFNDKARKLQEQVAQGQVVTGKEVAVAGYVHYREKPSKKGKTTRVPEIWTAGPVRPR